METPGAAPAVTAAKNSLVTLLGLDPFQFPGDQVQRDVPRHFDKGFLTPPFGIGAGILQITAAHRRPQNPRRRRNGLGNRGTDGRRIRVPLHWYHRLQFPVDDLRAVRSPMQRSETHGAMYFL
ncbi:hypothetical protein D3C80_1526720 [compost metagenome]